MAATQTFVLHVRSLLASPAIVDGEGVIRDGFFAEPTIPPEKNSPGGEESSEDLDEDGEFSCAECAARTPHRMGFVTLPSGVLRVTVGPHLVTGVKVQTALAGLTFSLSVGGDGHGGKFQVVDREYELALWGPGGQVIHGERGIFEQLL